MTIGEVMQPTLNRSGVVRSPLGELGTATHVVLDAVRTSRDDEARRSWSSLPITLAPAGAGGGPEAPVRDPVGQRIDGARALG
jgi:hypothetical protein